MVVNNPITSGINLKETDSEIQKKILIAVKDELNIVFPTVVNQIKKVTQKLVFNSLTRQIEFNALQGGSLAIELGLINGTDRLLNIIDIWLRNINVVFKKFRIRGDNFTGGIVIEVVKSNYSDVLDTDAAILLTEKGEQLPWLKWLLFSGDSIIISNYSVKFATGQGRTGGGIMVNEGSWGIPARYSGDRNNNFVTRALEEIQQPLQKEIITIIENKL